ncbi:thioesterase domain-containing protein [Arthrobacter sp. RAF14]|uniref:thioesterase domain-containing protein n=1 Tax=Arthrobacter sp. RAF14 TaxID=3233051 RepID=UPI003F936C20
MPGPEGPGTGHDDDGGAARRRDLASLLRTADGMRRLSRRGFLWLGGASAILTADLAYTRAIAEQRRLTTILTLGDDSPGDAPADAGWFLLPGFKTSWDEARFILTSLKPAIGRWGRMAAVGYSNLGLSVYDVVDAIAASIRLRKIRYVFLYGHSFGGMLAVETAVLLWERHQIQVRFILLDSSPASRYDVLDQESFDGVVYSYERGVPIPTIVRGGYELGERIVNKHERTWRQVLEQTAEQLSPLAPSSFLIQSEAAYVYGFDLRFLAGRLPYTSLVFIGNPGDGTVDYFTARQGWRNAFPSRLLSSDIETLGAIPAHASPQWSPQVYHPILEQIMDRHFPL